MTDPRGERRRLVAYPMVKPYRGPRPNVRPDTPKPDPRSGDATRPPAGPNVVVLGGGKRLVEMLHAVARYAGTITVLAGGCTDTDLGTSLRVLYDGRGGRVVPVHAGRALPSDADLAVHQAHQIVIAPDSTLPLVLAAISDPAVSGPIKEAAAQVVAVIDPPAPGETSVLVDRGIHVDALVLDPGDPAQLANALSALL